MAGTDKRMIEIGGAAPVVVLTAPQMGENIGAAARAMLNFGLTELRLVRPRDGWPNEKARAMASGADVVIDGVAVFDDLPAAVADCHFVAATTARPRDLLKAVADPADCVREMGRRIEAGQRCALLFGGERAGLASDDLVHADVIVTIPTNPGFASLNLAQSVLLMGYEWMRQTGAGGARRAAAPLETARPASKEDLFGLMAHLEGELEAAHYFFPPERAPVMKRNLRAIFARAGLTESETRSLRGVIKALAAKRRGE